MRTEGDLMKQSWFALAAAAAVTFVAPASAHVVVFVDHHEDQSLERALELPTIVPLWACNGFLFKPGQVDYITFTAKAGDQFLGFTLNPNKNGAREFAPSFALIGPGLPAPTGNVPFRIPSGSGAQIFNVPTDREIADEQLGFGALLESPQHRVTLPADGRYFVAIWDPQGKSGHYLISIGESEDETLVPNLEQYTVPRFGDVTGDGQVTIDDVRLILEALAGETRLSARQMFAADIGPRGNPAEQVSPGNGVLDAADALRILRRVLNIETGDAWPF